MAPQHTFHRYWRETVFRGCPPSPVPLRGMLCTDLDGTLIHGDGQLHTADTKDLEALKSAGWLRIIATGRSMESFRRAIPDIGNLPVDYLVFSSGVGILDVQTGCLVRTVNLSPEAVSHILAVLNRFEMDYMIHHPAPGNVRFAWFSHSRNNRSETINTSMDSTAGAVGNNHDFHRRIALYTEHSTPLDTAPESWEQDSAQVISVVPPGDPHRAHDRLRRALPEFNVIRTTSPLDGRSTWLEIYPGIVSKSRAGQWLRECVAVNAGAQFTTIAAGNDFNDLDMLEWADAGFVMPDAPELLRNRFRCLSGKGAGNLTELFQMMKRPEFP